MKSKSFYLFILIIIYSYLISLVKSGADYYKILGVSKDADESAIKKAFKKLSLKYHPDKNKNNPEKAKEKFAEIVNAYEVLKDPKQRRIYDQLGEEGLKNGGGQGGPNSHEGFGGFGGGGFGGNFNFDDIFSNFFNSNFGGGGGFHDNQQRGHHHQQKKKKDNGKDIDFFSDSFVFEINMGSVRYFYNRKEVWVVLFYKSNQYESKEIKDVWKELANKYNGIFRVASVNCLHESELCEEEFDIKNIPTIIGYTEDLKKNGIQFNNQNIDVQNIANFANSIMVNLVINLKKQNYENFLKSDDNKEKVILFSSKRNVPILIKSLALSFKDLIKFGIVYNEETFLIQKFKIENLPSIILLKDGLKYQGVTYKGENKKDKIMSFLREQISEGKKRKKGTGAILELNPSNLKSGICGKDDSNLCLIYISVQENKEKIKILEELGNIHQDDPINFFYVNSNKINYELLFPLLNNIPGVVIVKGKKNTYTLMNEKHINLESINNFIDKTIGGSSKFHKIEGDLVKDLQTGYKYDL